MQIKTIEDIKKYTHHVVSKDGAEDVMYDKPVYMVCPRDFGHGLIKTYYFILEGNIVFFTKATSKKSGTYRFIPFNEEVLPHYGHKAVAFINWQLAITHSEDQVKAYPDKFVPVEMIEHNYDRLYTTKEEAEQFLEDVYSGKIEWPIMKLTITTRTYPEK